MEPKEMFAVGMKVRELIEKHGPKWEEAYKRFVDVISEITYLGIEASLEINEEFDGIKNISPGFIAVSCMESVRMLTEKLSGYALFHVLVDEMCRRFGIESGKRLENKNSGEGNSTGSEYRV